MLEQKLVADKRTGTTFVAVGRRGTNTTHNYFTAMTWQRDSRTIVLSADVVQADMTCRYVAYDMARNAAELLEERADWGGATVSFDNKLYYLKHRRIHAIDLDTKEHRVLCSGATEETVFHGPLSVTNDGRSLGIYWTERGQWTIGRADARTGAMEKVATPGFAEPYPVANHAMINPIYANQIFYAHEGRTQDIPDRIWTVDADGPCGTARNLYRQQRLPDGCHGEYVGHEAWSYDGERLYFVKYSSSPLAPAGIYYVNRHGTEWGHLNGEHRHWHAAPSPDGRWIVSDTESDDHTSKIVLTDAATGKSEVLCEVNRWPNHPGHPHPSFSPDSKRIAFTFADEHNDLWVGCIELEHMKERGAL